MQKGHSGSASGLEGTRCGECGKLSVMAGRACPFCGSPRGTPVPLSGRGRLISWTVIRVAPSRYAAEAPYAVGLLELEEGPRLTARVSGDGDQLAPRQAVVFAGLDPARGPIFRPDSGTS
jgi:uncharacterized OB-fold protein